MTTEFRILGSIILIGLGMMLGEAFEAREIRLHTIVRLGFPYYEGVFFGECATVRDIQTNLVGKACAAESIP